MKNQNYLKFLVSFVMILITNVSFSQVTTDPDSVCSDSTVYYKVIQGAATGTSTFNWAVKEGDGNITFGMPAVAGNDSIMVQWNTYTGAGFDTDTITVIETTADGCDGDLLKLGVRIFSNPTAEAGNNQTICHSGTLDLSTSGTVTASNNSSVQWSTAGDGSFDNATALTPVYTPGTNDIANGSVVLTLRANANGPCSNAEDTMTLTFNAKPATQGIFHD